VGDASLLRFLIDLRGEDTSNKQLRDDLMTMLVAGHETTAAVLTWALFEIAQNKDIQAKLQRGASPPLPPSVRLFCCCRSSRLSTNQHTSHKR